MSGSFALLSADSEDPKFTHAVLYFDDESRLVFSDQRHFGLMKIVDTAKLYEAPEIKKLAPEPFSDEFHPVYVYATLQSSARPIKEILLDQTKFCGLGNIYAVEALFLAGIDPRAVSKKVTKKRADLLHGTIRDVLNEAIEHSLALETTPDDLERSYFGSGGWRVYDREGEACLVCKSPVKRIKQGSRSTFYCRTCQKK
jgi:formamidopyrimidine-DNA glycosylase